MRGSDGAFEAEVLSPRGTSVRLAGSTPLHRSGMALSTANDCGSAASLDRETARGRRFRPLRWLAAARRPARGNGL